MNFLIFFVFFHIQGKSLVEEFEKEKKGSVQIINEDSRILKLHRIGGYTALASASLNAILGYITLNNYYKKGKVPPDYLKKTHRYLGFFTLFVYSANTLTGFYNFYKFRNKKQGKNKRILHMFLSSLSTSLMIYGAYKAYSARKISEFGLYYSHRNFMLISIGVTLATIGVILW